MSPPRLRPAARAVVLDPDGRVLLVRLHFPRWIGWVTPGGGIDPGESTTDALGRELAEETGLVAATIGPVVWHRRWYGRIHGFDGQEEWYHLVRTPAFEPAPHFTPEQLAAEHVTGIRWWSLDEFAGAPEQVAPAGLADLVRDLVTAGPPAVPIELS